VVKGGDFSTKRGAFSFSSLQIEGKKREIEKKSYAFFLLSFSLPFSFNFLFPLSLPGERERDYDRVTPLVLSSGRLY
jgi:hypothetical protein